MKLVITFMFIVSAIPLLLSAQEQEPDESGIGGTGHENPISLDDVIFSRPDMPEINLAPEIPEMEPPMDLEDIGEASTFDDSQPSVSDTIQ